MLFSSLKARLAATSLLYACQLLISNNEWQGDCKWRRKWACNSKGNYEKGSMRRNLVSSWRLPSSLGASGWRKSWGQQSWGMLSPGHTVGQRPQDAYTWGQVHLGMCAAKDVRSMAMAGAGYFLYLTNNRNSWSEKFQKVVFQNIQVKALGMTSITIETLFSIT